MRPSARSASANSRARSWEHSFVPPSLSSMGRIGSVLKRARPYLRPQFIRESAPALRAARYGFGEHILVRPQRQRTARARDAGVEQLATRDAHAFFGQHEQHVVELGTLRLVHGQRERALVRRQRRGKPRARTLVGVEPDARIAVRIDPDEPDVAVVKPVAITVFAD